MKLIKLLDVNHSHNDDCNRVFLKEENNNYTLLKNNKEFMYGYKSYKNEKLAINAYNKGQDEFNKLHKCPSCGNYTISSNIYQYVDESNCSITDNSKPFCCQCDNFNSLKY